VTGADIDGCNLGRVRAELRHSIDSLHFQDVRYVCSEPPDQYSTFSQSPLAGVKMHLIPAATTHAPIAGLLVTSALLAYNIEKQVPSAPQLLWQAPVQHECRALHLEPKLPGS
jgi:hypothetical protein